MISFQPEIIYPNFFAHYKHPIMINFGDCYKWAYIAYKLFDGVELWSSENHAFIKYKDKFYDSESLDGVKSSYKLRTNKEYPAPGCPSRMQIPEFQFFWGQPNRCDWDELDRQISAYLGSINNLPLQYNGQNN